jgi:hypothetical protein
MLASRANRSLPARLLVAVTVVGCAGCGARTALPRYLEPDGGDLVDGAEVGGSDDAGPPPACTGAPATTPPGFFNAMACSAPSCDAVGGATACPCAGAASPRECGFDAIHTDGHIFTALCDPATGTCLCTYDGAAACRCQSSAHPAGLCALDSPLNCCF